MKPNLVGFLTHRFKRVWHWLGRPAVLATLIAALLAVLALGTVLPQLPGAASSPEQLAVWRALAQSRYGRLATLFEAAGAFRLYNSPLMWTLVVLLGAATLSCTLRRWPGKWRSVFSPPTRRREDTAAAYSRERETTSHSAVLVLSALQAADAGKDDSALGGGELTRPPLDPLSDIARRILAQHEYRVRSEYTPEQARLEGDRNRLTALGTLVDHLAVLIILGGVLVSTVFGWREILTVEPGGTIQAGHGSGFVLRNRGFEVERYQDGSPAAYTAHVTIEQGADVESRTIGVNHPTSKSGITFYLQGYRQEDDRYALTLLAVHDPGFRVVLVGALLFLAGTLLALYFPRSFVTIRIVRTAGVAYLTGWADHRAFDFDRDFEALAADLRRSLGTETAA